MIYDILVAGGGPAGPTAAIYARRAGKSVLVLEKETFGGQITFSPKVENIPGFASVSGSEFAEKLLDQALSQGAEIESCEILSAEKTGDTVTLKTDAGEYKGKTLIIATGSKHRTLGLPGEEDFIGAGISFCAVCDGAFYAGRHVAVIGGGNSALQEALLLSEQCAKVTVVQNLAFLTGERKLQEQIAERKNIEVILGSVVDSYLGEGEITGIRITETESGKKTDLALDGVFLAVGLVPQNEPFASLVSLDPRGYSEADETCVTRTEGVYVAGDCRTKAIRQVTTAASDGAVAALAACRYLDR